MTYKFTRRKFLKGLGLGTGAALLANMGLPAAFASDNGLSAGFQQGMGSSAFTPDVELLCGDVTGFQLTSDLWDGSFGSVTFQMHRAWHNGNDAYYIRTDASDQAYAEENRLVFVPLLNAALSAEGSTNRLYTFANPSDGQYPVISNIPSDEAYSPAWHVHNVTFNGDPVLLDSETSNT